MTKQTESERGFGFDVLVTKIQVKINNIINIEIFPLSYFRTSCFRAK